jgi:endonuclease YncB( thermonuclease family)
MRRLALTLVALAAAAGLVPALADARSGSCLIPGVTARCAIWTGHVTFVGDGDTFSVDLDGDGSHRTLSVRMTGINAFEQSVYSANPAERRGQCHALEATARLEQLIRAGGGRVRLAAYNPSSTSRSRWRRAVAGKLHGRWRDVGRKLVAEGHALWLPNGSEWLWNASYGALAERAARAHRGIWNPTHCGRGPDDAARLQVIVNGDADGDDTENLNGEWVRIRNLDPVRTVHLGGWSIQNSGPNRFVLPDWVTVTGGEELTVHVGQGTSTWTEVFLGEKETLFNNMTAHGGGDGAFLFDPQGDLRASTTYPCWLPCADPYQGALRLTVSPKGRESVTVRNLGTKTADLDGYRLWSTPDVYAFPRASILAPGEALKVQVLGDPDEDTRLLKSWGKPGSILTDGGDVVRLISQRGVQLDCVAYGSRTCSAPAR